MVLLQFAGTPAGALNLSRLLCQFLPKAITDKGARTALVNANGEQLTSLLPSGRVLTGDAETQFFSVQRRGDEYAIDCEISLRCRASPGA